LLDSGHDIGADNEAPLTARSAMAIKTCPGRGSPGPCLLVVLSLALACGIAALTNDTHARLSDPTGSDSGFAMSFDVGRLDAMVSKAKERADHWLSS